MDTRPSSQLKEFFQERATGDLRSVIRYDQDGIEVMYLRDDVADQYSVSELEDTIEESRMESLSAPIYENTFSKGHGELECMVNWFENVIEMNFIVDDGIGVAVALDVDQMGKANSLIADARRLVVDDHS